MMKLSRLEEITNLRKIWPNEAKDFTPWLSEDNNIALLSEAVGLDIAVDETESSVGNFNVDIFASEIGTDRKIIIENQLENTNHDHLGKLITYASGKSADVIIWVVKHAREEHRAAIEWLNNHTDGNIGFFLCEIKLFRIGSSEPAVKFEVIEKPLTLTLTNSISSKNYYIEIIDFLNTYGGLPYQDPKSAQNQTRKNELMMLKEKAREVSRMMFEICNNFASLFNLTLTNTIKKWLDYKGTTIRKYFWGQFKRQDSDSPISISLFANQNQFRLAIELDGKKTRIEDYNAYKKYLELPIDTTVLKFFGKPNSSSDTQEILDLKQEEVTLRLKYSKNIDDRIQLSYIISRIDKTTNSDRTADIFYQEIFKGLQLLLPYYNHIMDNYTS